MWYEHLGRVTVVKHRIVLVLLDVPYIHSEQYSAGLSELELYRKEVYKMIEASVAELLVIEWASPTIFVPEKECIRFCVNYRCVKAAPERGGQPVSWIDKRIDFLGRLKTFAILHDSSGYWQIETDNSDNDKTAFVTHLKLFIYTHVPSSFNEHLRHRLPCHECYSCVGKMGS